MCSGILGFFKCQACMNITVPKIYQKLYRNSIKVFHQFVFVPGAEDCKELWGQRSIRSKCLSIWIRGWRERTLVSLNQTVSLKVIGPKVIKKMDPHKFQADNIKVMARKKKYVLQFLFLKYNLKLMSHLMILNSKVFCFILPNTYFAILKYEENIAYMKGFRIMYM